MKPGELAEPTPMPQITQDMYASLPTGELVLFAVQHLHADGLPATAEEVVSICFKLFPHRFSLKNYFYWPDSAHVAQALKYAKEKKYVKETAEEGFILRPAGRQLAKQAAKAMGIRLPMPPKVEKPTVEVRTVDDRPQTVGGGPQTVEQVKKKVVKAVAKKAEIKQAKSAKKSGTVISATSRLTPKEKTVTKKKAVKTKPAPKQQKKVKETPKKAMPVAKPVVKKEAPKKIAVKKAEPKPVTKKEVKQPVAKVEAKPTPKKVAKTPVPKKKPPVKPVAKKELPKSTPQTPAVKKESPKPAPIKKESPKVVVVEKPKAKKETPTPAVKKEAPKAKAKKAAAVTQLSLLPQVSPKEEAKKTPPAKKAVEKQVTPKAEVKPAPVIQKEAVSKEEKAKAGKVMTMVERSDAYRQYKKQGAKANISEFDFRNMLFATMESSAETLKRNLDLFKRYAGFYSRADLITFFEFCERGFAAMLQPSAKKKR
jgi:hypothetical protein